MSNTHTILDSLKSHKDIKQPQDVIVTNDKPVKPAPGRSMSDILDICLTRKDDPKLTPR